MNDTMTLPPGSANPYDFSEPLAASKACHARHQAALPDLIVTKQIDTALRPHFPYLHYDEPFQAAMRAEVKLQHAQAPERPLTDIASALAEELKAQPTCYMMLPKGPAALTALYPAYSQMAKEAHKDNTRIGVTVFNRPNKFKQHGDYWRERVEELRGTAAPTGQRQL